MFKNGKEMSVSSVIAGHNAIRSRLEAIARST